jgi:HAD superfamily hydrolase (TIGR01509 family)
VPIDLVIFDCDGVLVDSEALANEVLARLLTEAGLSTTTEEAMATYVGLSMPSVVALAEERLGAAMPDDLVERYHAGVFAAFDRELRPVEGVVEVVDAVDALGWATCVASSGEHERMRRSLGRTGLYERFAGRIFSASEVERGKPHPDLFFHAAREMGADPSGCVVVEDSAFGVRAAVAAAMVAFGYAEGERAARLGELGATTFGRMSELPALLELVDRSGPTEPAARHH